MLCFLLGTVSKIELDHDLFFRAAIPDHVAFHAVPGGVPVTALPSSFSIFRFWQWPVIKGACIISFFEFLISIWTIHVVATVLPL